jgi:alkanesulfonate monooxygenase SsuD/methylene tetrahydromethanopterin reductase-like flavin-dependent oxidoreductase (luciferase family)
VTTLRHAIDIAPLGPLAAPAAIVRLAVTAEASGWDGVSVWDSLGVSIGAEAADPFVALAAVASRTERISLITSVLALPRRRPQLVAQAAATLDRWSGGRLVLGVGSGGDAGDFEPFGESFQGPRRGALLDEGLLLLDRWLRADGPERAGETDPVPTALGPKPVQDPRPPIWIGGMKAGAIRRAGRWDGWVASAVSEDGSSLALPPAALRDLVDAVGRERTTLGRQDGPFAVAILGMSEPDQAALVEEYAHAGATWWLESLSPMRGSIDDLLARVAAGPPHAAAAGVRRSRGSPHFGPVR